MASTAEPTSIRRSNSAFAKSTDRGGILMTGGHLAEESGPPPVVTTRKRSRVSEITAATEGSTLSGMEVEQPPGTEGVDTSMSDDDIMAGDDTTSAGVSGGPGGGTVTAPSPGLDVGGIETDPNDSVQPVRESDITPLAEMLTFFYARSGGIDKQLAQRMAEAAVHQIIGSGSGGGGDSAGRLLLPASGPSAGHTPVPAQLEFVRSMLGMESASSDGLFRAMIPAMCKLAEDNMGMERVIFGLCRDVKEAGVVVSAEKMKARNIGTDNEKLTTERDELQNTVDELRAKLEGMAVEAEVDDWETIAYGGDGQYQWVGPLLRGELDRGHNSLLTSICDKLDIPRTRKMSEKLERLRQFVYRKAAESRWPAAEEEEEEEDKE